MLMVVTSGPQGLTGSKILLTDPLSHDALRVVNANAFPPHVKFFVDSCIHHVSTVGHAVTTVQREIEADASRILHALTHESGDIEVLVPHAPVVTLQNVEYLSGLNTSLWAAKAALDVFAKLVIRVVRPDERDLDGFKKGTVGDTLLSGGKLIQWLRGSLPKEIAVAPLADFIERESRSWITAAVTYRDDVAHRGTLQGAVGSQVILRRPPAALTLADVSPPKLPNGTDVATFCSSLYANLKRFLREASLLVPGVRGDLLK